MTNTERSRELSVLTRKRFSPTAEFAYLDRKDTGLQLPKTRIDKLAFLENKVAEYVAGLDAGEQGDVMRWMTYLLDQPTQGRLSPMLMHAMGTAQRLRLEGDNVSLAARLKWMAAEEKRQEKERKVRLSPEEQQVRIANIRSVLAGNAEWYEAGNCFWVDGDFFFSDTPNPRAIEATKRICRDCPVIGHCEVSGYGEPHGIWAGQTVEELRTKKKNMLRRAGGQEIFRDYVEELPTHDTARLYRAVRKNQPDAS